MRVRGEARRGEARWVQRSDGGERAGLGRCNLIRERVAGGGVGERHLGARGGAGSMEPARSAGRAPKGATLKLTPSKGTARSVPEGKTSRSGRRRRRRLQECAGLSAGVGRVGRVVDRDLPTNKVQIPPCSPDPKPGRTSPCLCGITIGREAVCTTRCSQEFVGWRGPSSRGSRF